MSKTRLNIPSLLGVLSFILPLAVYTIFACPTVAAGDSGELITAAFTLGVAHPPGYPLFCLLGKGMTYLPLSNIAFRVNLLAGLFGALSVWMLFLLLKRLLSFLNEGKAVIISFFTVLAVGFSALFFEQAMHAKGSLYTLNVFLIITLMYSVLSGRSPLLSGFIAGLSMANHHTALTFCGMLFLYQVFVSKEKVKSGAIFLGSALLTAVAIYMYLPLAANTNPPINWGNPKDLESALFHIFRIQYGEARMPLTVLVYLKKLWPYAGIIFSQLSLFSLLALPGLYLLYKKKQKCFSANRVFLCCILFSVAS